MEITEVRAVPLSDPVPEEKRHRTDLGTKVKTDATLVFVETDTGHTGVGAALGPPPTVESIVEGSLAPALVGEDPTYTGRLWEKLYSGSRAEPSLERGYSQPRWDRRGYTLEAISGVDIALWDVTGKAFDQPVYKLLGAVRDDIRAYASGIFPMGDDKTNAIGWFAPDPRGILPLDAFHVPDTLAKLVRQDPFEVVSDRDFEAVIRNCADRERTWITPPVIEAYTELHEMGYAHSVECWHEGELAGGIELLVEIDELLRRRVVERAQGGRRGGDVRDGVVVDGDGEAARRVAVDHEEDVDRAAVGRLGRLLEGRRVGHVGLVEDGEGDPVDLAVARGVPAEARMAAAVGTRADLHEARAVVREHHLDVARAVEHSHLVDQDGLDVDHVGEVLSAAVDGAGGGAGARGGDRNAAADRAELHLDLVEAGLLGEGVAAGEDESGGEEEREEEGGESA